MSMDVLEPRTRPAQERHEQSCRWWIATSIRPQAGRRSISSLTCRKSGGSTSPPSAAACSRISPRRWPIRACRRKCRARTHGRHPAGLRVPTLISCARSISMPTTSSCGILIPLRMNAGSQRNLAFGAALCRAINNWQVENWCRKEERLRGSIQISADDIKFSVAEIERCAADPTYVQILVPPRNLEPLGRRRYWPILEAAVAANRPIAMHVGGVSGHPAGAGTGTISYYVEEHQSLVQAMQAVLTSLVVEGVFERFPTLKIVMVEAGFAWLPALAWRLDAPVEAVPHGGASSRSGCRPNISVTTSGSPTQPIEEPGTSGRPRPRYRRWIGEDRISVLDRLSAALGFR